MTYDKAVSQLLDKDLEKILDAKLVSPGDLLMVQIARDIKTALAEMHAICTHGIPIKKGA